MNDKRLNEVLYKGLVKVEELVEFDDYKFILDVLNKYPTSTVDLVKKLAKTDKKELLNILVETESNRSFFGLFDNNISEKNIIDMANRINKAKTLDFNAIDTANKKYDIQIIKEQCKDGIDLEKFYSQGKDEKSISKTIQKGKLKEASIDLVIILEKKLSVLGYTDNDLSVNLTEYFEEKYPSTEYDDDGYEISVERPQIIDLIHRLRIMRNNYVHGKITKSEPLNIKQMLECLDYIFNEIEEGE